MAADYYGTFGATQDQACAAGLNLGAVVAKCTSGAQKDWTSAGCGTPRLNEMNRQSWSYIRKCQVTPPALQGMCHNSFTNGKATVQDIYTSDQSKWVVDSMRYGGQSFNKQGCDCDIPPG